MSCPGKATRAGIAERHREVVKMVRERPEKARLVGGNHGNMGSKAQHPGTGGHQSTAGAATILAFMKAG